MIKLTIFGTYGNMPDYPPPPSSFLVYTSLALFSFAIPGKRGARQIESSSSTTVTSADFLILSVNYLLLTLTILAHTDIEAEL